MGEIVVFNQTKADLAVYKEENARLVFDYEGEKGNKMARSHVYKLAKARSAFDKLRVATKAEALAACKNIDAAAKLIKTEFDEMIAVHQDPIKRIEEREEAEKQAALDKIREDREKEEAARLADLEAKEKELKELKAKAKADEELIAAAAREKQVEADKLAAVEQAKRDVAEQAAKDKLAIIAKAKKDAAEAEEKRLVDIAAAERKAKDLAEAKEEAIRKSTAAATAEKARLAQIEADRIADESYRKKIEQGIIDEIFRITGFKEESQEIVDSIVCGQIPNLSINY